MVIAFAVAAAAPVVCDPAEAERVMIDARIDELRTLDEQLARYGDGVEAALGRATERLISRLAQEPGATLSGLAEPLSRG